MDSQLISQGILKDSLWIPHVMLMASVCIPYRSGIPEGLFFVDSPRILYGFRWIPGGFIHMNSDGLPIDCLRIPSGFLVDSPL